MKVSVVIPTLNEGESIGPTIDQIPKDFANLEIMIVDGMSKDDTVEIAKNKSVRVVMEERKGYGRAYKTGFSEAKGDIICTLDGDMTYPAEMFPKLVKMLIDEELDFITCDRLTKAEKGAMNATHKLGNWALKFGTNMLFGTKLIDSQSGMWVFRKEILEKINMTSDGMPYSEEIKIECFKHEDIKAKEVSVPYRARIGDIKLNTWGDGVGNLKFLFSKRMGKAKSPEQIEAEKAEKEEKKGEEEGSQQELNEGDNNKPLGEEKPEDQPEESPEIEPDTADKLEVEGPAEEKEVETDNNSSVTVAVSEGEEAPDEEKKEE